MTCSCLLRGSPTLGRYLGVAVLDEVRGERVLDSVMLNIMHSRTFVEECVKTAVPVLRSISSFADGGKVHIVLRSTIIVLSSAQKLKVY
jgi:hypothetical protein